MAEGGFGFDREGARRIVRAVKATEGTNLTGKGIAAPLAGNQCITALLTAQDATDPTRYAWSQQRRTSTGWEAVTDGLTGTTTARSAWNLDESSAGDLTGQHVVLVRMAINIDSTLTLGWIIAGGAGGAETSPQYAGMVKQSDISNQVVWQFLEAHQPI